MFVEVTDSCSTGSRTIARLEPEPFPSKFRNEQRGGPSRRRATATNCSAARSASATGDVR